MDPVQLMMAAHQADATVAAQTPDQALQAAIAACHARAATAQDTPWARIAQLYQRLAARTPSPVVELNRAVAVSMAFGTVLTRRWQPPVARRWCRS